jgi:DNA-binding CsgD family transcriptional regulator
MFYYNVPHMSIWRTLLHRLGLGRKPKPRTFRFEEALQLEVRNLAIREERPEEEIVADLLTAGLQRYDAAGRHIQSWQMLSPREQDVTALVCLGYTNRQIAAQLGISAQTVKTHLGNILAKFRLHSRKELRTLFFDWDFSAWKP